MTTFTRRFCVFIAAAALVFAGAAGCQPAKAPTRVPATADPTIAPTLVLATGSPVQGPLSELANPTEAGYPGPVQGGEETPGYPVDQPVETEAAYPGLDGSGPAAGVPAIENQAKITAKVIEVAPDPENSTLSKVRALILASTDIQGMQNMIKGRVNQEVDLYGETASLPALNAGDQIEATVSLRADERGGKFFLQDVQKK